MTDWKRTLALNAILILFSLLLAGGMGELFLRLYHGNHPLFKAPQVRHERHPQYGYRLVPNQSGTYTLDAPVTSNSLGFRDSEWAIPKPAGQRRVMVIGDSLTFGNGVAGEAAYAEQLEALLKERFGDVEVMNVSAGGWNSPEEAAVLLAEGQRLQPDVVFLGFYMNDYSARETVAMADLSGEGRLESRPWWLRWLPYETIYLLKRSALLVYLRNRIPLLFSQDQFINRLVREEVDLDRHPALVATYERLRTMKAACDAMGVPFVIGYLPSINQFWMERREAAHFRHMRQFASAAGIHYIDLSQGFWGRETNELYLYPWDYHLSSAGHALVAQQLLPLISRLLEGRTAPAGVTDGPHAPALDHGAETPAPSVGAPSR